MLNVDYKILSKVLAYRMKPILGYLIDEDQTGFMEGRNLATNIHKTTGDYVGVVKYMADQQIPAFIMTIDFEKYFDHIEHTAVKGSMEYFGFRPKFIKWIMLLLNDFELCTQINGHISTWFKPTRSIHQGCCVTPYLYLLCGQVLSDQLKQNPNVKGIQVYDVTALLSQFADDTTLF